MWSTVEVSGPQPVVKTFSKVYFFSAPLFNPPKKHVLIEFITILHLFGMSNNFLNLLGNCQKCHQNENKCISLSVLKFKRITVPSDKPGDWRKKYGILKGPYNAEMITEVMEVAGKNISNNMEKLLEQIRAVAEAK